ncbi:MAG: GTP-binding protein [Thiofilum sp.]|uniref:DUF697 domain-containing protein n=1 Tax=Thiofilum sp. TaxID=2212733 RepID=UPI003BB0AB96
MLNKKTSAPESDTIEVTTEPRMAETPEPSKSGEQHLKLATDSLRKLFEDNIPDSVRDALQDDYEQVKAMLDKLEQGHVHIAVFGRVSVGKSSLLNALIGKTIFSTSVLHGETKQASMSAWSEYTDHGIYLIDTPGINEVHGEEREKLAFEVSRRADLLLFVVDSDLTEVEFEALKQVAQVHRPIILVVNKADRYNENERKQLRAILRTRTQGIIAPENIVFTVSQPRNQTVITVDENGEEHESVRIRPVDIAALKTRLWDIIEADGKTLSALNASLFASDLSQEVSERILQVKRELGAKTIRLYCIAKGVAVAVNPIPVADLVAAAAVDAAMVLHLSKLYGLPMSMKESKELITVIATHLTLLMGATWAVHLLSSALKVSTFGVSTLLTAATQGALAWYSTLVIGQVAERWLANGKSWGDAGPKFVVQQILDSLDRDSVMSEAREEILSYIRTKKEKDK